MMKLTLRRESARVTSVFLIAVAVTVTGAWGLGILYGAFATPKAADSALIIETYRRLLRPEPGERFVFITLAFTLPLLCLAGATRLRALQDSAVGRLEPLRKIAAWVTAILFLGTFWNFEFSKWLTTDIRTAYWQTGLLLACFLLGVLWYRTVGLRQRTANTSTYSAIAFSLFFVACFFQMAAWRVAGINAVFESGTWSVHFDAVIYPLSQVVGGKTLLADLPSQYGLFPEMMAPLFKVGRLSVKSFTLACAAMQLLSMTALWWVLHRTVLDRALRIVGSLALVMLTFESAMFLIGIPERYFQYWPVRFFWPAISVVAFYRYSRTLTDSSVVLFAVVAAVGALWNADSGSMIILAFLAFLGFKLTGAYLHRADTSALRVRLWKAAAIHVLTVVLTAGLFIGFLYFKAAGPLHLSWLYEYQITFYKLGFTMLPMPVLPTPWMAVMGVYLMGVIVGISAIVRGKASWRQDIIFYLSLLGVGLFLYYQGRSHILNLITVAWPAVLVGAMLADQTIRLVRAGAEDASALAMPAAALGILAFCAWPLVWNFPALVRDAVILAETRHTPVSEVVDDELHFIREHAKPGESCAILSVRQGIYYAETRLVSPLSGPGYVETVLQSDQDRLLQQLKETSPGCVFFGIGPSTIAPVGPLAAALKGYTVKATNRLGTLEFLVPPAAK
ncbi:hypothetical protein [Achromobacter aloeverae]|nr:hypothetical protein [Achromobacter aloeverae]